MKFEWYSTLDIDFKKLSVREIMIPNSTTGSSNVTPSARESLENIVKQAYNELTEEIARLQNEQEPTLEVKSVNYDKLVSLIEDEQIRKAIGSELIDSLTRLNIQLNSMQRKYKADEQPENRYGFLGLMVDIRGRLDSILRKLDIDLASEM